MTSHTRGVTNSNSGYCTVLTSSMYVSQYFVRSITFMVYSYTWNVDTNSDYEWSSELRSVFVHLIREPWTRTRVRNRVLRSNYIYVWEDPYGTQLTQLRRWSEGLPMW